MPRIKVNIHEKSRSSLDMLQRIYGNDISKIINELIIKNAQSYIDDNLCRKNMYSSCAIFKNTLQFSFPYECEFFEIKYSERKVRGYLERIPKRELKETTFSTLATIIVELEDDDFPTKKSPIGIPANLRDELIVIAYGVLKNLIVQYRRITNDYYNIGPIAPPINENFQRDTLLVVYRNFEFYSSQRIMPVKESSIIVVINKMPNNIHSIISNNVNAILNDDNGLLTSTYLTAYDQAIISYYQEEWNLCIIFGIIAMESYLSQFVHNSKATTFFISKNSDSSHLRSIYKKTQSYPKKICRFLFPFLINNNLKELENQLRKLMPLISNKKNNNGLYELRCRIVHEGHNGTSNDALRMKDTLEKYFKLISDIYNSI